MVLQSTRLRNPFYTIDPKHRERLTSLTTTFDGLWGTLKPFVYKKFGGMDDVEATSVTLPEADLNVQVSKEKTIDFKCPLDMYWATPAIGVCLITTKNFYTAVAAVSEAAAKLDDQPEAQPHDVLNLAIAAVQPLEDVSTTMAELESRCVASGDTVKCKKFVSDYRVRGILGSRDDFNG